MSDMLPVAPARRRVRGTHDSELTRGALLDAGEALFAAHGYRGATVAAIAARARANPAMIGYHFGGKLGLYKAILARILAPVLARLEQLSRGDAPAPERLAALLRATADLHAAHPALSVMVLREMLESRSAVEDELARYFGAIAGAGIAVVGRGVADGSFRPVDPFLTHLAAMGAMLLFFATRGFRDRLLASGRLAVAAPPRPEAFVEHLVEMTLGGLGARRPSRRKES